MKVDLAPSLELQIADGLARAEPLRYLNLFRLILAGFFLVAGRPLQLGGDSPTLFIAAAIAYVAAVLILGFRDAERLLGTPRLVTLQVLVDITLLTVIMWASGGYRSGIPILILVALAGAGLVGQGRMVLFYAAYATVAVLLENAFRLNLRLRPTSRCPSGYSVRRRSGRLRQYWQLWLRHPPGRK